MQKYQICVGGCPIGIVTTNKTKEKLIESVKRTHPTQEVTAVLFEEMEILDKESVTRGKRA